MLRDNRSVSINEDDRNGNKSNIDVLREVKEKTTLLKEAGKCKVKFAAHVI